MTSRERRALCYVAAAQVTLLASFPLVADPGLLTDFLRRWFMTIRRLAEWFGA